MMKRKRTILKAMAMKVGGPARYALRHAHAFPHLLYQLWHDADVRWTLGRGMSEVSGWWEHHAAQAARQHQASWWHRR